MAPAPTTFKEFSKKWLKKLIDIETKNYLKSKE